MYASMKAKTTFYKTLERKFPHFENICIVTNCFPPCPEIAYGVSIGGISKKYERFVDELRYHKKKCCVISMYYGHVSGDQESRNVSRIGVYRPYSVSNSSFLFPLLELFNPSIFVRCLKVLMKQRPDLVVVGGTLQMSLAPILAAKALRIEVIIQHDWLCPLVPKGEACDFIRRVRNCGECLEESMMSKQRKLTKVSFGIFSAFMLIIKRNIWNRCHVFAEGNYFRSFYVESGIKSEKINMAPPSPTVDGSTEPDQKFMNELVEELGNAKVIAYIGRLSQPKGIELLLESFRVLKDKMKEGIKLVVAGDGPLRDLATREAERDSDVLYLGWLPKDKLKCVYLLSDIAVIPSIAPEAYPHVALEALSLGKRVIGFRMGGLREIAEKNHLVTLVENIDVASLTEAIMKELAPA
jgi:glycosyltransferase involved in cell wall biosynthesis